MNTIAEANAINCKKRNCGFVKVNDKILNFYNKNIFLSLDVNLIRISACDSNVVCLKMCLIFIFLNLLSFPSNTAHFKAKYLLKMLIYLN